MEEPDIPTLVIQFNTETNEVRVEGPIKNRMLAYGMLKLAEKAIDEDYQKDKTTAIVPARNGSERFIKRY